VSCTPVSMLVSLWPCITTSAPILQLFASNSCDEEMCQQVPSASVAMPPLFIALRVVFFDVMFAVWLLAAAQRRAGASRPRRHFPAHHRPASLQPEVLEAVQRRVHVCMRPCWLVTQQDYPHPILQSWCAFEYNVAGTVARRSGASLLTADRLS
jgi:hypothetical protein